MQVNTANGFGKDEEFANWINETDKGIKRAMRLREVADDTLKDLMNGCEFKPSHLVKSMIFHSLFSLEASGQISLPCDVFEWVKLKKALGKYAETFDGVFEFKKSPGRPTKDSTTGLNILRLFLEAGNKFGKLTNSEEVYWILLRQATILRLAQCEEWSKHRSSYERKTIYAREFKAAKTSVDRLWQKTLEVKPPRLASSDRPIMKEEVLRHLASRK